MRTVERPYAEYHDVRVPHRIAVPVPYEQCHVEDIPVPEIEYIEEVWGCLHCTKEVLSPMVGLPLIPAKDEFSGSANCFLISTLPKECVVHQQLGRSTPPLSIGLDQGCEIIVVGSTAPCQVDWDGQRSRGCERGD